MVGKKRPGDLALVVKGRSIMASQLRKRHVLRNHIVRDESIGPRLTVVARRILARLMAPSDGNVAFGDDYWIGHLIFRLGFEHVDAADAFSHEVRLVLRMVNAHL